MPKIRLIPAIDIIGGKCVRLSQGDYAQQKTYDANPVEVAKRFEDAGIKYLHVVDLDGAKAGKVVNWQVLRDICKETKLKVDFGGGLRATTEVEKVFDLGINQVTGGSIAVKKPAVFQEWLERFGGERIILGMDLKEEKVAIHGWETVSTRGWEDFLTHYVDKGIQYVICTDIERDGMLSGPALGLYQKITPAFPKLKLVASGGVSDMSDIHLLDQQGLDAVIFGKAFYEGNIGLHDLSRFQSSSFYTKK